MHVKSLIKKELSQYFNWAMKKKWVRNTTFATCFAVYAGDKKLKYKALAVFAVATPIPGAFFAGVGAIGYYACKDLRYYFNHEKKERDLHLHRCNAIAIGLHKNTNGSLISFTN